MKRAFLVHTDGHTGHVIFADTEQDAAEIVRIEQNYPAMPSVFEVPVVPMDHIVNERP